ncbi:hypothetical protein EVC30_062 [Rhizobium phage RHph_Y1_11]|nr:hypothetical protein EVC30_062 [Rhizobium phage RHph_Y1_11]
MRQVITDIRQGLDTIPGSTAFTDLERNVTVVMWADEDTGKRVVMNMVTPYRDGQDPRFSDLFNLERRWAEGVA